MTLQERLRMWAEVLAASEDSRAVSDIRLARDRLDALEAALKTARRRLNGKNVMGEYVNARLLAKIDAALAPPVKEGK